MATLDTVHKNGHYFANSLLIDVMFGSRVGFLIGTCESAICVWIDSGIKSGIKIRIWIESFELPTDINYYNTVPLSAVNGLSRLTKLMNEKGAGTANSIWKFSNRPIPFESNRTANSNLEALQVPSFWLSLDFFHRGLHTRTAVAHNPCIS